MKKIVYELVVDVWRLICKYRFSKLTDTEWQEFVVDGYRLQERYREYGSTIEMLLRDMFTAVQNFYERAGGKNQ